MGRRIFISDMHMGDKRSVSPGNGHPYSWFYDDQGAANGNRPDMLASFLEQYCFQSDIEEVVVLGDLFDQWVCPVGSDPTDPSGPEQFMNIANAPQNKDVIDLLRQLASKEKLKYLTGNHDMLADENIMSAIFPKIRYIDAPGEHAVYKTNDGIWAEHGHWYGLFNAPYPYPTKHGQGFSNSILPIGFFVTRVVAEEALVKGKRLKLSTVFLEWYRELLSRGLDRKGNDREIDSVLVKELFATLVKKHAAGQESVVCKGVGGIPDSLPWNEISERYDRIFSEWKEGPHNNHVDRWEAVVNDIGNLDYAANKTRFYNEHEARIVLFGHTHKCGFTGNLMQSGVAVDPPSPTTTIYANAGAWANEADQCTFVETEVVGSKHYARLMEWFRNMHGQNKPIKARAYSEDYIEL